jgi:hypothetical protein
MTKSVVFLILVLLFSGFAGAEPLRWKALLATGYATDDGAVLDNWENAREAFHTLLVSRGVDPRQILVLSARSSLVGTETRGVTIGRTSRGAIQDALVTLAPGPDEGLIVFLTSHGQRGAGFSLEHDGGGMAGVLSPADLAADLSPAGNRPVVVLISACYSGQFLDPRGVISPSRVVLTAARRDRSSFGCGAGTDVPEWDESLIRVWKSFEPGFSWEDLARAVADDITAKEAELPAAKHSLPQSSVGMAVGYRGF